MLLRYLIFSSFIVSSAILFGLAYWSYQLNESLLRNGKTTEAMVIDKRKKVGENSTSYCADIRFQSSPSKSHTLTQCTSLSIWNTLEISKKTVILFDSVDPTNLQFGTEPPDNTFALAFSIVGIIDLLLGIAVFMYFGRKLKQK